MPQFQYKNGYLYCKNCGKHFKEEICPIHESKVQKYRICPSCPQKYKMRRKAHNKSSHEYYLRVIKPQLQQEKDIIIKWKQKPRQQQPTMTKQ